LSAAALPILSRFSLPSAYPSNVVLFMRRSRLRPSTWSSAARSSSPSLERWPPLSFHIAQTGEVRVFRHALWRRLRDDADTLYPAKIAHISRQVVPAIPGLVILMSIPSLLAKSAQLQPRLRGSCAWLACQHRYLSAWRACCWFGANEPGQKQERSPLPQCR